MKFRFSIRDLFWLVLAVTLAVGHSRSIADDGTARHYTEFADDELTRTFSLLERTDVQEELKMTPEQIAKVKQIDRATNEDVPGLQELMDKYKKRQSASSFTASDQKKLNDSLESDLRSCVENYQSNALSATLSANQKQRLGELLLQMRGPIVLATDVAVISKFRLSDQQMMEMKKIVNYYEADLKLLLGRYGRQQISAINKNETQEERQKEVEALFIVIRAIEKERDTDLLLSLTSEQLKLWSKKVGSPFSISWSPAARTEFPASR